MQTTFNVSPPSGMPGMPFDNGFVDGRSFPALVAIPFGVLCELVLSNGNYFAQPLQDTGTAGSFTPVLAGVSRYNAQRENALPNFSGSAGGGAYKAGEMVPFARRGRIWVQFDGTGTWPEYATPHVWHSSTGANPQGVFTMHATQTTVGAEIDNAPAGVLGIEAALAIASYTDGFGNTLSAAVVSLNLG